MNPFRVKTRADLEKYLEDRGFTRTNVGTGTGKFWKSVKTGKHIQIPEEYQDGMFPEFYLKDFYEAVEKISAMPQLH